MPDGGRILDVFIAALLSAVIAVDGRRLLHTIIRVCLARGRRVRRGRGTMSAII